MLTMPPPLPSGLWSELQRVEGVAPDDTEAGRWVEAVERHRLLPLAVGRSMPWPDHICHALEARLAERKPEWRSHRRDQDAALARLIDVLPDRDFIVVKGADMAARLYGDPTLRPMDDVDLLLRESRMAQSVTLLEQTGWKVTRRSHLEVTLRDPHTGVVADLYRGHTQRERASIDKDVLWQRATRGPHGALSLCDGHALLMECLVFANALFTSHLRRLVDLWLFAKQPGAVDEAIDFALEWRLRRPLYAAMRQLELVAPEMRDASWYARLKQVVSAAEQKMLERDVLPPRAVVSYDAPSQMPAITRVRAKFALIDSPAMAAHFFAAHSMRVMLGRR